MVISPHNRKAATFKAHHQLENSCQWCCRAGLKAFEPSLMLVGYLKSCCSNNASSSRMVVSARHRRYCMRHVLFRCALEKAVHDSSSVRFRLLISGSLSTVDACLFRIAPWRNRIQVSSAKWGFVLLRALTNSFRLASLTWNATSDSLPRNSSYRSQTR